jgi:prepilin-type N-terminal cleavage/methylation domain-containing protein
MALAKYRWTADVRVPRRPARAGAASARGFSLLEVLVATTIMTVGVAGLAQMFVLSTRANTSAKVTTYASVLAQQKMEQLRGLTWGFDVLGLPMTDTTTNVTVVPETAVGGKGLSPSPESSLGTNTDGYCDFVDKFGKPLGGGTVPPAGTAYIRRWSVEPLPTNPNNTIILQVLVTRSTARNNVDTSNATGRAPDEARLVSVKTRKAS